MRRLVRTGREPEWEIGPDGRVIPRRQEAAIPPSWLAYRRRNSQVSSVVDNPGTKPVDPADR